MQNRYAGDIGDFGKFGLLRHIVNASQLRLGINWYLLPDEKHNEDGRYIRYLCDPAFEQCDQELYGKFRRIVEDKRSICSLEKPALFKVRPVFFSKTVDSFHLYPAQTLQDRQRRLELRREWKDEAVSKLSTADVIFLDPDNGLQVQSCSSLSHKNSGKYSYFEEIREFHKSKKLTIIYHHLNRHRKHGTHSIQVQQRARELKEKINPAHKVFGVRFRPFSPRAFFLISAPSIESYVTDRLNSFVRSGWREYWDNFHSE